MCEAGTKKKTSVKEECFKRTTSLIKSVNEILNVFKILPFEQGLSGDEDCAGR
jgi:hypothetical protein